MSFEFCFKDEKPSSGGEESEDDDGSDDSSDSERERKKQKKSKKKKKKHKKKKKKHKRSDDHSEEREEREVKRSKKDKSDSFWGDGKPFDKVSNGNGESQSRREEYQRDRDSKPRIEYTDERRPVDLGREAKPYPTGASSSSYHSSR